MSFQAKLNYLATKKIQRPNTKLHVKIGRDTIHATCRYLFKNERLLSSLTIILVAMQEEAVHTIHPIARENYLNVLIVTRFLSFSKSACFSS
jgi:hypothetical protein